MMNASKKTTTTACFLLIVLTFLLLVPPARGSAHEGNGGGVTGVDDYGVDLYDYYSMTDLDMEEGETLQPFTSTTTSPTMNDELGEDDVNNSNIVTQEEITRNGADFFGGGDTTMPSYPSYPDPYASPFYYGPAAGGAVSGNPPLAPPPANAVGGRGRRGRKKPRVQKPRRRGRRGKRTTTRRGRRGRRPSYGYAMPPPPPPYYYGGGYLAAGGQHYYHYPHPAYYSYYYPPVVYPTTNYYYPPSYPTSYYDGGGGDNYLYPGAGGRTFGGGGGGCATMNCACAGPMEVDSSGCPVCPPPPCAPLPGFGIRNAWFAQLPPMRGSAEAPAPDDDDFLKEGDV
ncbi:hypothetical protein RI054_32g127460 [Pseudoscourfieldia marina]